MNIWVLIWLGVALTLLYFMGWNLLILYRQKKAWSIFADKEGLRYDAKNLSASPEMNGTYKDYTVSLFTGEHLAPDGRGSRKLAAIEVQLSSHMPFEAAMASGGMVSFVRELRFNEEVKIKHKNWRKDYIAASNTPFALQSYLTDERVEAIMSLVRVKNGWLILVFKGDTTLLRFDTADPLDKTGKIRAILNRMVDVAQVLELQAGESKQLKEDMARTSPKEKALQIDDEDFAASSGLQLDEDDAEELTPVDDETGGSQTEKPD
ncbi:hypothetical protein N9Z27_01405 [Alphaproteobacteria bacterium]|nr:hypothetical protein [Alphaproteobacteria bacterium]